jgi:dTDP-4-dehydrorhamnose 3,5-epimerase
MRVIETGLPGVLLIEPTTVTDSRGEFFESWSAERYEAAGVPAGFVQDNVSRSARGVLRGMHMQHPRAQAKLVSVLEGRVFDVSVDLRVGSPTFGRWVGVDLSAENHRQLYIPEGFAHGFLVLSEYATFAYKCSDYYARECEIAVRWDDPALGIRWPAEPAVVSAKDAAAPLLAEIAPERLPQYAALAHAG